MRIRKAMVSPLIIAIFVLAMTQPVHAQMSAKNLAESGTIKDWWESDEQTRLQAASEIVRKARGTISTEAAADLEKCISDATRGNDSFKSSKIVAIALSCEGG